MVAKNTKRVQNMTTKSVAIATAIPLLPKSTLDALAIKNKTEKSSLQHDYMRFYEFILGPYLKEKFILLELGVGIPSRKAPFFHVGHHTSVACDVDTVAFTADNQSSFRTYVFTVSVFKNTGGVGGKDQ